MALQAHPQQQSPFFNLPAELRIIIYNHTLVRQRGPVKIGTLTGRNRIPQPQLTAIPLLRTCRRFYDEALPIFYGTNDFRFYNPRHGCDFLQTVGQQAREAIRGISVRFGDEWHEQYDEFFELVVRSVKVERLHIRLAKVDFQLYERRFRDEPMKWHPLVKLECVKEAVVDTDWGYGDYDIYGQFIEYSGEETRRVREEFEGFMDKLEDLLVRNAGERA